MKRTLLLVALAITLPTTVAHAQRRTRDTSRGVELGIDGGISFGLDDPKATLISLPVQDFRVGFLVSDRMEFEPRFSISSVHTDGGTATQYSLALGVLFQPGGDRVGRGLYLRPFLGIAGASVTGFGSDNNAFAGAGIGVKLPLSDRRLATRLEANYTHGFDTGGSNTIGLLFGLSFFTR
jgi:hypothetical protein